MKILACDPYHDEEYAAQHGIAYCSFETLLRESDVLSIHAPPLTDESRHLFSDREFAVMKPGARLINCARGEIVDEKALYRGAHGKRRSRAPRWMSTSGSRWTRITRFSALTMCFCPRTRPA
jgi:phosphoglycerate dehydrogenase-like enzyme